MSPPHMGAPRQAWVWVQTKALKIDRQFETEDRGNREVKTCVVCRGQVNFIQHEPNVNRDTYRKAEVGGYQTCAEGYVTSEVQTNHQKEGTRGEINENQDQK